MLKLATKYKLVKATGEQREITKMAEQQRSEVVQNYCKDGDVGYDR